MSRWELDLVLSSDQGFGYLQKGYEYISMLNIRKYERNMEMTTKLDSSCVDNKQKGNLGGFVIIFNII